MTFLLSALRVVIIGLFVKHAACEVPNAQKVLGPTGHDAGSDKVLEAQFGFNISWRDYNNFTVEEALGGSFNYNNVEGMVALVKGDPNQPHSAEVLVKATSPDQSTLDCIELSNDKASLRILTKPGCTFISPKVHIDIVVAVRPGTLQFGNVGTHVASRFLDIIVWRELYFETYMMTLRSQYGDVGCQETSSFAAHDITVASDFGKITGNWSLPRSISFSTIAGEIDLDLPPKRWSSGPSSLGALTATSKTGNINIRMPFELGQLSLRNLTTNIVTDAGAVHANIVHGAVTHIQTVTGSINATLLPYWAFYQFQGVQFNYITTVCNVCSTHVNVLTPSDNYYAIPALFFARSKHVADTGNMVLTYPKEWAGVAEWKVDIGAAKISGGDFEVIEDGGLSGKIQRRPLGSKLFAGVKVGALDLTMKA